MRGRIGGGWRVNMRKDWTLCYDKDGRPHWGREAHGCRIAAVGKPDDTSPEEVPDHQVYAPGPDCTTIGGLVSVPDGVDVDDYVDAFASLLVGFMASVNTRALAMLGDKQPRLACPGPATCHGPWFPVDNSKPYGSQACETCGGIAAEFEPIPPQPCTDGCTLGACQKCKTTDAMLAEAREAMDRG